MHLLTATTTSLLLLGLTPLLSLSAYAHADALPQQELPYIWAVDQTYQDGPLDPKDPNYEKCASTDCAKWMNIYYVCDGKKTDGNYTWDPEVAKDNLWRCLCGNHKYLPELEKCEKCTGTNTYDKQKAECDKRKDDNSKTESSSTTTKSATTTQTVTKTSTTVVTTTEAPTESSTTTTAAEQTPTQSGSSGIRIVPVGSDLGWHMGFVISGAVVGFVAMLAGVV